MSKNTQTFGDWCIENNKKDLLDRWDYELNYKSPFDIGKNSNKEYYFKCPRGIHESELYLISYLTRKSNKNNDAICRKCNSIGQFIIDKYGIDYLNKILSNKNNISPFEISRGSGKKVWLKCLKDNTHPDYEQMCSNYIKGIGCPYCSGKSVCLTNSFGYKYPQAIQKWSDKNEKTPYDYTYGSNSKVWFKCENEIHDDYYRSICNEIMYDFKCPLCSEEDVVRFEDLSGQKFGRLTALYPIKKGNKNSIYWTCKCECGNTTEVLPYHLKSGRIKSCGCLFLESVSGENNSRWKGGITPENVKARNNDEYKEWRKSVYKKDWYACQCCGNIVDLRAHHLFNFSDHEDLRYDVCNGITLCKDCHDAIIKGSFHNIYGTKNNTPEQLEEYINNKRKEIGIEEKFSIEDYLNGKILKPIKK